LILPIVAYGHPVLRKIATDITSDYANLAKLLEDMWETMYASNGVGLAAPQINRDIRLFIVDSEQIFKGMNEEERKEYPGDEGLRQTFINAHITDLSGEAWGYNEGCLSIPKVREDVYRQESVTLSYCDENFVAQTKTFVGLTARIILHEYDHIEGKLFIDHLSPLKRKLLKSKLTDITKGKIKVDYKMSFPG
jgi:peptide deformylase